MSNWRDLQTELSIWDHDGLALPFWWRDDDAVDDTPALRQLSTMATQAGLPICIAVIPAHVTPALADFVGASADIHPCVHGLAHRNHAPENQKKAEFGDHRDLALTEADAANGLARLRTTFGPRLAPVFVPPWNRVRPDLYQGLADIGFEVLSTFTPRQSPLAASGLTQINTHIDPIDWRGSRGLIDEHRLLSQIIKLLQDRRAGRSDRAEPLGLLTHHLVHDAAIWSFCARFVDMMLTGPATPWHPMQEHSP